MQKRKTKPKRRLSQQLVPALPGIYLIGEINYKEDKQCIIRQVKVGRGTDLNERLSTYITYNTSIEVFGLLYEFEGTKEQLEIYYQSILKQYCKQISDTEWYEISEQNYNILKQYGFDGFDNLIFDFYSNSKYNKNINNMNAEKYQQKEENMSNQLMNMKKNKSKNNNTTIKTQVNARVQNTSIDINKLTKEDLKPFIDEMSEEDRRELKAQIRSKNLPNRNSEFFVIRSYIYNHYIKPQNTNEQVVTKNGKQYDSSLGGYLDLLLDE